LHAALRLVQFAEGREAPAADISPTAYKSFDPPAAESDQNEEYLSIIWGILRVPIPCTQCGKLTRTPSYWSGDQPSPPICTPCFRFSIWGH
jgi:hypothetical protein